MPLKLQNPLNELYIGNVGDNTVKKNLNIIVFAAAVGMVCFSITGGTPMTGFATSLGATDFQFGLLWAFPVLANLFQFVASYFMEKTQQVKKIFMVFGVVQRFVWLIAAFLPYIVPDSIASSRIFFLIIISTMSSVAGSFVNITFYSFFCAMVPMEIRGRYISFRSALCTVFSFLGGFSSAFLLDNLPGYTGFTVVFSIASVFGMADILMFTPAKFHTLEDSAQKKKPFFQSLFDIMKIKKTRDYIIFWCVYAFTINIASAFFGRFAIKEQGLSYTQMILFGQIPCNLLSIIMLPRWGRALDRYGSRTVIFFAFILNALGILVWIPAQRNSIVPIFLFNFLGGMIWCALDISAQSMLISHTPEDNRSIVTAIYFVGTSISSATAFTIGGIFLDLSHDFFKNLNWNFFDSPISNYKILFIIAIVLRLSAALIFVPRIENEKDFTIKQAAADIVSQVKNFRTFKSKKK